MGTSFNVGVWRGGESTSQTRKEERRIASCLGLTQTTLSGMPLLAQRLASLNQRILITSDIDPAGFNEELQGCQRLSRTKKTERCRGRFSYYSGWGRLEETSLAFSCRIPDWLQT